jgi:hypothetical protein
MLWGQLGYVYKRHYIMMDSITKEGSQVKDQRKKNQNVKNGREELPS